MTRATHWFLLLLSLAMLAGLCVRPLPAVAEPWRRHVIDDSSRGADGVRLADVNGDGHQDICTGWEEGGVVRLYLNPGPERSRQKWAQGIADGFRRTFLYEPAARRSQQIRINLNRIL
jgi:hypothetical protein